MGEGLDFVEVAAGLQLIEVGQGGDGVVAKCPGQVGGEPFSNHDAQHRDVGRTLRHGVRRHLPAVGAQRM